MGAVPLTEVQAEVLRLRVEERLSFREIQGRVKASKSSLSRWLQNYPLTEEELRAKHQAGVTKPRPGTRKDRGSRSKYHEMVDVNTLTRGAKGEIAEAAVLFRLTLHGLHVMAPVFDGGRTDWLVQTPAKKLAKIQVKWARTSGSHGLPFLSMTCTEGHDKRRRYTQDDFDFLVGYDLFTDTAYVFGWEDLEANLTAVTIREEAAENWSKVLQFGVVVQREDMRLAVSE